MEIPCPKCGSARTSVVPNGPLARLLPDFLARRLLRASGRGVFIGRVLIRCRDCGFRSTVIVN